MEPLWRLPAGALAALVGARAVSAREATEATLARMDAVGDAINAVVERFDAEALAEAEGVDRRIAAGEAPGPLAGVPVTIKILTDQAGHVSSNGLRLDAEKIAAEDNPCVAALRRAGAVIVGRTNTPAFSIRWFTRNSLHGATLNPHDAGLTPGGSSGGASSAVAAGLGTIAHGTDIAGSVRYPAYACNVHGLRPSLGRVAAANPSALARPIGGQLMSVSGPLARRIDDLALALRAMAAPSADDAWWVPAPLDGPPLARRIALVRAPDGMVVDPAVTAALEDAARVLAAAGWIVEEATPPSFREAMAINLSLWMAEFARGGRLRLEAEGDADAIAIAARLSALAEPAPSLDDALAARTALVVAWARFLEDWPLVLCPVSAKPPFPDHLDLGSDADWARVAEAQLTQFAVPALGLPALSVATGRPGAPMGVHLIGPRFREDWLFAAGRAIEAAHPPIAPVDPFATGRSAIRPA